VQDPAGALHDAWSRLGGLAKASLYLWQVLGIGHGPVHHGDAPVTIACRLRAAPGMGPSMTWPGKPRPGRCAPFRADSSRLSCCTPAQACPSNRRPRPWASVLELQGPTSPEAWHRFQHPPRPESFRPIVDCPNVVRGRQQMSTCPPNASQATFITLWPEWRVPLTLVLILSATVGAYSCNRSGAQALPMTPVGLFVVEVAAFPAREGRSSHKKAQDHPFAAPSGSTAHRPVQNGSAALTA
jgi:hypothetical protein